MRNRGEKKIVNDLLSSPDLLVDCCVFDARSPRQKGRILTKSAPVPWLSSRYHDFVKKMAWDPCLRNNAQTCIHVDPGVHGTGDAACDAPL